MTAQNQNATPSFASAARAAIEAQRAEQIANARVNKPIESENRRSPNQSSEPKPTTHLYLNTVLLGYDPDAEEGFVRLASLPYGQGVDTMNPLVAKNSDTAEYVETVIQTRNAYLGRMVELGFKLEPGESRILTPVIFDPENPTKPVHALEVRRIKEPTATKPAAQNNVVQLISAIEF